MSPPQDPRPLNRLRHIILHARPDELDMDSWGRKRTGPICNTTCCAADHAFFDPWMRKHAAIGGLFLLDDSTSPALGGGRLRRLVSSGDLFNKLAVVFNIDLVSSFCLFESCSARYTKERLIRNIDRILQGVEPINYESCEGAWADEEQAEGKPMARIRRSIARAEMKYGTSVAKEMDAMIDAAAVSN